jgi:hypothetical protein
MGEKMGELDSVRVCHRALNIINGSQRYVVVDRLENFELTYRYLVSIPHFSAGLYNSYEPSLHHRGPEGHQAYATKHVSQ